MKRKRFFLGPIKNPTWKDFVIRVGGVFVFIAAVIFASRAFIPGHVGLVVVVVCVIGIAFVAVQEWRQRKAWREERKR